MASERQKEIKRRRKRKKSRIQAKTREALRKTRKKRS